MLYNHIATTKLLSDEIFQFILQLLTCKEDAAFHCSEWKTETFGNLTVLETGNVHGERDFIVAWKGIDDAVHFFQVVRHLRYWQNQSPGAY